MIQFDSRKVKKGDTFVAIKGLTHDGNDFIDEALKKGAVKIYKNSNKEKLGKLASSYFDDPSKKIKVIGVTGTKGKTTTCHIIHHILNKLGHKTGLISSITTSGFHTTTPDVISLNQELASMVNKNYEYAVVEVSSHGIDQGRIEGIKFYATVLTNIAPEHLDYHKTFKEYKKTKLSFFNSANIKIKSPLTTNLTILEGDFNNINAETATIVAQELGIRKEEAIKTLKTFKLPEGRLEEIRNNNGFRIFVDFAHTPDSLDAVLKYLKSITKNKPASSRRGKLISVFGCAGERDPRKRSKMGKIASELSDIVILTAEDPRTEDVNKIIMQIKSGISKKFKEVYEIPDRKEAINFAIKHAKEGDLVAVLGKGHEKSMNLDGKNEIPWSDQEVIRKLLK